MASVSLYTDAALSCVEPVGGIRYRLTQLIVWQIGHPDGPVYTVPPGFTFDVSVPWFARWLFDPRERRYLKAAALHDHMLVAGWDPITAAAEFHGALRADGVPAWRRIIMLTAVVLWRYR